MPGSIEDEIRRLDDEIRKIREQSNIWAEEARLLEEHADEHSKAVKERIRKARKRLERLVKRREGGEGPRSLICACVMGDGAIVWPQARSTTNALFRSVGVLPVPRTTATHRLGRLVVDEARPLWGEML